MTYPITGIPTVVGTQGQVPLRRELDEWWFSQDVNDINQRTLFILALIEFLNMAPDPEDPSDLSYFSIAGIHGWPLKPWDTKDPKAEFYCAHGEVTFPTWHRPYMLLYEQRLWEIMKGLIETTFDPSDHEAMKHAADSWRLPYWDWAKKKPNWQPLKPTESEEEAQRQSVKSYETARTLPIGAGPNVPFLLTQDWVQIRSRTGSTFVRNPMQRYSLANNPKHPEYTTFGHYGIGDRKSKDPEHNVFLKHYSDCIATNRQPTAYKKGAPNYENDWIKGAQNNWEAVKGQLVGSKDAYSNTLPETVYRLFSQLVTDYNAFATAGWDTGLPKGTYSSLETVHGNVHGLVGGYGFMGDVPVAAFDPIFWMHHSNIDRLFGIWQDMYPEKYDTWLNGKGSKSNEKLAPFHKDENGSSYDSHDCSFQQRDLGYTYPMLQRWLPEFQTDGEFDPVKYKDSLLQFVETEYSTTGKSTLVLKQFESIAKSHVANLKANAPENLDVEFFPPALKELADELPATDTEQAQSPADNQWTVNDYIVNIVYSRFALEGDPFSVRIYLGDVPNENIASFESNVSAIAQVYNFNGRETARGISDEGCERCKETRESGALNSGQIVLTDYLVEQIKNSAFLPDSTLNSLSESEVVPYLQKNLHWRVIDRNEQYIDPATIPEGSIYVSVAKSKATHYLSAVDLSTYDEYKPLWGVTEGRSLGANPGDLGITA